MRICDDLRQAVLQAAIQGKLTKQLPEDGNAKDLLKQIAAEKASLIKKGKIKKEKPLPEIMADEVPFDIPDNWQWCRLIHICSKITDGSHNPPPKKSTGYRVISAKNIKNGEIVFEDNDRFADEEGFEKENKRTNIKKNDVILGIIGGSVGNTAIYQHNDKVIAQRSIAILTGFISHIFIKLLLDSPFIQKKFALKATGTAQGGIYLKELENLLVPLPPLAEQQRIVARVEELIARIDDLEKTETELEKLKAAFPGDMKAALLQAAMQGKLTEQLPEDGNAADLLEQIAKEKSQLIKDGKIKKEKPLPEITPDEVPFDIPENWKWVRLDSIIYNRGQKTPDADFTYIDIGSIDNKTNTLGDLNNILSPQNAPSRARKIVQPGDIIYATVRPYLHNTCIIDRDIIPEPIVSTGFAVLSVFKGIYNQYLFRCLLSPMFDAYANSNENSKGVAYPAINDNKLMAAYIPLPPLAEQKRIVEKLDKLLPLCDGLIEK